jgi:hypothetical protein
VSVLLYLELFSCCVDFMILEGDNLSAVFPHAALSVPGLGLRLTAKQVRLSSGGAQEARWCCAVWTVVGAQQQQHTRG